jgi:hypothetical protein
MGGLIDHLHETEALLAGPQAWDEPRSPAWTLRGIAEHVAGVRYYAEQVGRLA